MSAEPEPFDTVYAEVPVDDLWELAKSGMVLGALGLEVIADARPEIKDLVRDHAHIVIAAAVSAFANILSIDPRATLLNLEQFATESPIDAQRLASGYLGRDWTGYTPWPVEQATTARLAAIHNWLTSADLEEGPR